MELGSWGLPDFPAGSRDPFFAAEHVDWICCKVQFLEVESKIESRISRAYRCPQARKTNFATDPRDLQSRLRAKTLRRSNSLTPGERHCAYPSTDRARPTMALHDGRHALISLTDFITDYGASVRLRRTSNHSITRAFGSSRPAVARMSLI